jgi:transcriptional regulator with GAF, ATPase, and Fis domain
MGGDGAPDLGSSPGCHGRDNGGKKAGAMDSTENEISVQGDPINELTVNFSETVRTLFSAGSVTETLAQMVELAEATIEGCDYAGLFLLEGDEITTPLHGDPIVHAIDALQHRTGEGPCLDAIAHRVMFYAEDLARDSRWSRFGPQATAKGLRSVLALPLAADSGALGALNLYARYPAAFGVVDRAKAVILASLASLALSAAHTHEDEERRADNLHAALTTREVIGQAQGILMERERITADQAFDILRRASQYLNLKLREVAQTLVDTGERPETGPSPS